MSLYKPLNVAIREIRLLVIRPDSSDAPLHASFRTISLPHWTLADDLTGLDDFNLEQRTSRMLAAAENAEPYVTVSYAWGDHTVREDVFIDGISISVPYGAVSALRRLRQEESQELPIWIDALCVNQQDLRERADQVRLMGAVYRHGRQNFIWLGFDAIGSLPRLQTRIQAMDRALCASYRTDQDLMLEFSNSLSPVRFSRDITDTGLEADELEHLLTLSWFDRTWVVQEVLLSPNSIILWNAHFMLPFATLSRSVSWIFYAASISAKLSEHAIHNCAAFSQLFRMMVQQTVHNGGKHRLMNLLCNSRERYCSEPRDKVFAMTQLFLQNHASRVLLQADYSKGVKDVFRDASRAAILAGELVMVLIEARLGRNNGSRDQSLPSWVSDLRVKFDYRSDPASSVWNSKSPVTIPALESDPDDASHLNLVMNSDILQLSGVTISSVATVGTSFQRQSRGKMDLLRSIYHESLDLLEANFGGRTEKLDQERMIAEVLIANHPAMEQSQENLESNAYATMISCLQDPAPEQSDVFWKCMEDNVQNRRLFVTRHGMLGIGPVSVAEGHTIIRSQYLLHDAILSSHEGSYKYEGDCFIAGLKQDGPIVFEPSTCVREIFPLI